MRHRIKDKKFNRDTNARKALFMALMRNLTEHGEIVTTLSKAKVLKGLADKMITQAKVDSIASRRQLHRTFGKRDVVNTLVDRVAPAMADRTSGYTRIVDMGNRRGDNTPMAKISFVNIAEGAKTLKSGKEYAEKTVKAVAKKVAPVKVAKEVKEVKKAAPKKKVAAKK
jgi:large subunit ribosomal protein L17